MIQINVKNEICELHYKFSKKVTDEGYEILFMYDRGLPTLICYTHYEYPIYHFVTHELYEECLSFMIANKSDMIKKSFIDFMPTKNDYKLYYKILDEEREDLSEYYKMSISELNKYKDEVIKKETNDLKYGGIIPDFDYFINNIFIYLPNINGLYSRCHTCTYIHPCDRIDKNIDITMKKRTELLVNIRNCYLNDMLHSNKKTLTGSKYVTLVDKNGKKFTTFICKDCHNNLSPEEKKYFDYVSNNPKLQSTIEKSYFSYP